MVTEIAHMIPAISVVRHCSIRLELAVELGPAAVVDTGQCFQYNIHMFKTFERQS
jgi:hypothetical protein